MHLIKFNALQILIYYKFRHRGAKLKESFGITRNKIPTRQTWHCIALVLINKTLKF